MCNAKVKHNVNLPITGHSMRFFRGKLWIFAAFFALCGSFSPLAARVCGSNEIAPMCAQRAPQCDFSCHNWCRQATPNAGILGSVEAPLPPQKASLQSAALSLTPDSLILEANFASPVFFPAPPLRITEMAGEVDPPPRRIFGFSFSCRAPPLPC